MTKITKRTGGVKTKKGKAITRFNSLKHGLTSERVLPNEVKDYRKFHKAMFEDLAPQGYLETQLAERITLTTWRLRRIEAFEAIQLEQQQQQAMTSVIHGNDYLEVLSFGGTGKRKQAKAVDSLSKHEVREVIESITHEPAHRLLDNPEALRYWIDEKYAAAHEIKELPQVVEAKDLLALSEHAWFSIYQQLKEDFDSYFENPDTWAKDDSLTPKDLVALLLKHEPDQEELESFVEGFWEYDLEELPHLWKAHEQYFDFPTRQRVMLTASSLEIEAQKMQELLESFRNHIQLAIQSNLVLEGKALEKLQRYEAHLERVLYRALHELEAKQDKRLGKDAPLARVEVHRNEAALEN